MNPTPMQMFMSSLYAARSSDDPTVAARRMIYVLKLYAPLITALADTIAETQVIVDSLPVSSRMSAQKLLDDAKALLGYTCEDIEVSNE